MMATRGLRIATGMVMLALGVTTCAGNRSPAQRSPRWLLDRGDAEAVIQQASNDPRGQFWMAEAMALRGRLSEAERQFAEVAAGRGPDAALAAARQAEVMARGGRRRDALQQADRLATALEGRRDLTSQEWLALGLAYQLLGSEESAQFRDALAALDRAIAADSALLEAQLRLGDLFLDKYNFPDARRSYQQVLVRDPDNPRAQLGLALVGQLDGNPDSGAMLEQSVRNGPGLARAHAALARLDLDAESFDSARVRADRAIALDSAEQLAWAVRAATQLVRGDSAGFVATETQLRARHAVPADFYAEAGEALARQRRYREAADLARRGVALDPDHPAALTALGTNELRLGRIDTARTHLDHAFRRDPYHLWNKNTLDLLDRLATFRTIGSNRIQIVAPADQAELLALYLVPLLEAAYDTLAARYRHRPPVPIRLEIYGSHADFSVRTVGIAGIGALGVSFGSVLAMDAPSARDAGEFNWASTAWHELVHAFTLGATDHRVPRWLSEGLSVLEERRARAGWGAQASPAYLAALKGGRLRSVATLNDGFVRPRYPAEIGLSYYHASLLCEYLETTFGFDAILGLLDGYRRGLATGDALRGATGISVEDLDRRFNEWLAQRFATPLKSVAAARDSAAVPGELETLVASGIRLRAAGQLDQAVTTLERADRIFPDMGAEDGPAWHLAEIHRARGDTARAIEYLSRVTRYNESHYEANRREAELRAGQGDPAGALAALERAIYIHPYDQAVLGQAAELAAAAKDYGREVRERRAIVALMPTDRAGAYYALAVAYRNAGDVAAARREVLRALEEAPSFEPAQQLLLELRGGAR